MTPEPVLAEADPDAPPPTSWTPEHVALHLVEAFRILDRMPRVRGPREPGGHWPRHRVEWADQLAQAELPEAEQRERAERRFAERRPNGEEIARMDACLEWLRALRTFDATMALVTSLWALRAARRRSVRALCREKDWALHTFYRVRARSLDHIAAALNARGTSVF